MILVKLKIPWHLPIYPPQRNLFQSDPRVMRKHGLTKKSKIVFSDSVFFKCLFWKCIFVLLPVFWGFLEAEVFLPGRPRARAHFPQRERSQWHSSGQKNQQIKKLKNISRSKTKQISADQKLNKYQQIKKIKNIGRSKTKKISADQKTKKYQDIKN